MSEISDKIKNFPPVKKIINIFSPEKEDSMQQNNEPKPKNFDYYSGQMEEHIKNLVEQGGKGLKVVLDKASLPVSELLAEAKAKFRMVGKTLLTRDMKNPEDVKNIEKFLKDLGGFLETGSQEIPKLFKSEPEAEPEK